MTKLNKLIITLVIVIIILIVGISVLYFYSTRNIDKLPSDLQNMNTTITDSQTQPEITIEKCNELKSEDERLYDNCLIDLSKVSESNEYCDKISDENLKIDCYEKYKFNQAVKLNQPQKCFEIKVFEFQKGCLKTLIDKSSLAEVCNKLDNNEQKTICQEQVMIGGSDI